MPAALVRRVYHELLGRAPERDEDIEGVSPLDFCLAVASSDERKARFTEEMMRDHAQRHELQVAKTSLGYMLTHVDDEAIGSWLRTSGAGDEADIGAAVDLISQVGRTVEKKTFLEVGANIGTHGLRALKDGFERVVAIEPDATNFKLLRANQILNDKFEFCTNIQAAASDIDGAGVLELSPDNFGDHRVRSSTADEGSPGLYEEHNRAVSATRLARIDTLLEEHDIPAQDIGLVWIDTQGHEGHALAGAQLLIAAKVPMVAEFWPYGLRRSGGYDLLRQSLEGRARLYNLEKFKESGDKTPLGVDDLDRMLSGILEGESESRAAFTDIVILFDE